MCVSGFVSCAALDGDCDINTNEPGEKELIFLFACSDNFHFRLRSLAIDVDVNINPSIASHQLREPGIIMGLPVPTLDTTVRSRNP
jgi:hypothetical protein